MDTFQLIFYSMSEGCFLSPLFTYYPSFCWVWGLTCLLLVIYFGYSKVVSEVLEKTKIPKLYKIITLRSLWMGLIHLMTSVLCFFQLSTLLHPAVAGTLSQPFFLKEVLYTVPANLCEYTNSSLYKSIPQECSALLEEFPEWTPLNTASIYIMCAVLVQEILLSTRNKMDHVYYSRILGLIFVIAAGRLRCPTFSIQGTFLMSINTASKEIACALTAWKAYFQEDCDHRPLPGIKFLTFLFFVIHMVVWFSLMLFYLPLFIHKLPPIIKDDADRFFLAYSYLSILAYTVLEATTSPIWTTIRCLAWCRRSSGTTWRILALSDCHLLGHYSPLVQELFQIQTILDEKKALSKYKMVAKHLAFKERRKRQVESLSQNSSPHNLRAAVTTVLTLKRKIHRRRKYLLSQSGSLEDQFQGEVTHEDSNIEGTSEDTEIIALMGSNQDCDNTCESVLQDVTEVFDNEEEELNFVKDGEGSIERTFIQATVSGEEGTA